MATVESMALAAVLENDVSACVITHGLKVLGGGSMQMGLIRYGEKMFARGLMTGRIEGVVAGAVLVGVPTVTIWGISKIKKAKADKNDSAVAKKTEADNQASSDSTHRPEGNRASRMSEPVTA